MTHQKAAPDDRQCGMTSDASLSDPSSSVFIRGQIAFLEKPKEDSQNEKKVFSPDEPNFAVENKATLRCSLCNLPLDRDKTFCTDACEDKTGLATLGAAIMEALS